MSIFHDFFFFHDFPHLERRKFGVLGPSYTKFFELPPPRSKSPQTSDQNV